MNECLALNYLTEYGNVKNTAEMYTNNWKKNEKERKVKEQKMNRKNFQKLI